MQRFLLLLAVLLGASLLSVSPSRAQFAACTPDYVRRFDVPAYGGDPGWSAGPIECVEYFRFSFSTPHGERHVRGIGDVNVGALLTPGAISAVEQGARRATRAMAGLGDFDIDDTTILITFSVSTPAELSDDHDAAWKEGGAAAWTLRHSDADANACHVTLFLLGDYSASAEIPYMVSHELFHCVQKASLSLAQNQTASGSGLWWIEGSAELFAAVTVSEAVRWNRARSFENAVRNERPLYAMSYAAAPFFYWLHQVDGLGVVMPFLHAMSSDASDASQRAALRGRVNDERLLAFAQAYDDRDILHPSGAALPWGAHIDGETWSIEATSTQRRVLKPFVITPGWADYACGTWANSLAPAAANIAARRDPGETWGAYPAELDNRTGARAHYRTIAMHSGDANVNLSMHAERRASCAPCLSSTVIDQCVVGVWEQSGGGPMAWLQRQGIPQVTRNNIGKLVLEMHEDGTFSSRSVPIDYQIRIPGGRRTITSDAYGGIAPTSGRWSAADGRLQACFDSGGNSSAVVTMETRGVTATMPHSTPSLAGFSGSSSYTCSATALTTSAPTPRGGPMTYEFRRLTPPPEH